MATTDLQLTAAEVKDALRKRYPAFDQFGRPGQWTTSSEWLNIDLLAYNAWHDADVIGHEVKISRSDMRSELLKPSKRSIAVASCTQFYFAVPAGLLTTDEIAYKEPEWGPGDFVRLECPAPCRKRVGRRNYYDSSDKSHHKGMIKVPVPYAGPDYRQGDHGYGRHQVFWTYAKCPTCGGKGHVEKSRVEREAPTLWVPRDCGLITVSASGTQIVKRAPKKEITRSITGGWTAKDVDRGQRQALNQLIRWTSARPDPRHH